MKKAQTDMHIKETEEEFGPFSSMMLLNENLNQHSSSRTGLLWLAKVLKSLMLISIRKYLTDPL